MNVLYLTIPSVEHKVFLQLFFYFNIINDDTTSIFVYRRVFFFPLKQDNAVSMSPDLETSISVLLLVNHLILSNLSSLGVPWFSHL